MTEPLGTDKGALERRLAAHARFARFEINDWILSAARPQPGERVLDVGCGTGKQLLAVSSRVGAAGEVVGLDVSPAALVAARDALAVSGLAPYSLVNGTMEDLDATVPAVPAFDLVLACFSLYYAARPLPVLQGMRARLRPGGRCFVCGPAAANNAELLNLVDEVVPVAAQENRNEPSLRFMEETAPPLFAAVFSRMEVFSFENPVAFPTPEDLLDYWRSYHLYSPSHEEAFAAAVRARFARGGPFVTCKRVKGVLLS
jgi:SAM-dependent methyltransferase